MTTAAPARRGRILLVEDDQEAAYFAVHVLTTMGRFDVTHTADPRVALDRARSEPWDLVLTDLDLPTMTGLDLLAALRQAVPGLPVAVITADAGAGPGPNAARRQADAFLQKPVPAAQLVAVAATLIGVDQESLSTEPRPRCGRTGVAVGPRWASGPGPEGPGWSVTPAEVSRTAACRPRGGRQRRPACPGARR
jgi:CheY-like chemotaxis protein